DAASNDVITGRFTIPYPDDRLQIKEVKISNKGNLFILSKLVLRDRKRNDYKYKIFKYVVTPDSLREISLPDNGKFITDLIIKPDRNENLFCGGFFSEQNSSAIIGTVFYRIEPNDSISVQQFVKFEERFLANYLTPKQIERGKELNDFYLDQMVLRSDGGIVLLAEQYYVTTSSYRDIYGFWYNRETYHYDDVVLFSMDKNGNIEWSSIVQKQQTAEIPSELSYFCVVSGEQVYVFYKSREKGFGSNIYYRSINANGKVSNPKSFFERYESGNIFYRNFSEQISNSEAILVYYQVRGKIFTLVKVAF
ncbi:MAG: hypothetical protein NZ108_01990, partial [Bacteroidia bacterium]|nr:hypothetical protein [Bacteroidia bacterium]